MPSLDGGENWFGAGVGMEQSHVINGEISFCLLDYSIYADAYYIFGNRNEENKVILSVGDKIDVALRFAGNDDYFESEATATAEYTMQSYTGLEIDNSFIKTEVLPVGGADRYIFKRLLQDDGDKQYYSFKLYYIECNKTDGGEDYSTLEDVSAGILSLFEYKFITKSEFYTEEDGLIRLTDDFRLTENGTDTSGWTDYNGESGITYDEYKDNLIHVSSSGNWTTDGEITGTWERAADEAYLVIRLKASGNALKSEIKLVILAINEYDNDNWFNGNEE